MALIIKGDMPKGCAYCFAYDDEYCQCRLEPSYDGHWSRENHCPILGEIPDKHGDLKDVSILLRYLSHMHGATEHDNDLLREFEKMIRECPTVMEATE